jgi:predicted Rossmann fold nucleotide-binding protein DprA/Smf involved in DNA uptake
MQCTCQGCDQEARFSFVWAWGADGVCCERHRFILGQQARSLKRACTIAPLDPGAPKPIGRDERVAFHAKVLALEEELQELQARGLTLTESHQELSRQLRTATAQKRTVEAELEAHRERVAELGQELAKAQQAAARANADVDRLSARLAAYEVESPFDPAHTPG